MGNILVKCEASVCDVGLSSGLHSIISQATDITMVKCILDTHQYSCPLLLGGKKRGRLLARTFHCGCSRIVTESIL